MFSFKTAAKRVLEAILVLTLVLFAFLIILYTLNRVFPVGQDLFSLVRPGGDKLERSNEDGISRELHLVTEAGKQALGRGTGISAVLTNVENSVKSKRAAQIAWQDAKKDMVLYNRDAIQTFRKSSAMLSFGSGNSLELDENSLIIIRQLDQDPFLNENRSVVVLMDGQLTGQISRNERDSFNLEVIAPGAVARVLSKEDSAQPARFRMAVNPDESSILTVLEGTADLVIEGESLQVGANQIVKVEPGKQPVYLTPPPGPPMLRLPLNGETFTFRDVPPILSFEWEGNRGVTAFHYVVATDPDFESVVYEGRTGNNRFSHGNLKPGDYFWKVSSIRSDQEGRFGDTMRFALIQDLKPPPLTVDYPENPVGSGQVELKGKTESEARVFVGGIPVMTNENGEFTHNLLLQRGSNVVVVEAVDNVGNVAYFSRIINAEF